MATTRSSGRTPRPRAPPASTAGTACCPPRSIPTGSCCGSSGPPMSSIFASASSRVRSARFHGRASFTDPVGPPSLDAPLSESSTTIVSSRSPVAVEEVEHPADLRVGVGQERREALHVAGVEALLVGRERVPGRNPVGSGRQLGVGRQQSHRPSAGRTSRSRHASQPAVEPAPLALDPLGGGLVGRVARAGGEIEEERLVRVDVAQVAHELDRAVGQVLGQVVAVLVRPPVARPGASRGAATGANWLVSPPKKPYQRSKPRPSGHVARDAPRCMSSSGVRCHLPTA